MTPSAIIAINCQKLPKVVMALTNCQLPYSFRYGSGSSAGVLRVKELPELITRRVDKGHRV